MEQIERHEVPASVLGRLNVIGQESGVIWLVGEASSGVKLAIPSNGERPGVLAICLVCVI